MYNYLAIFILSVSLISCTGDKGSKGGTSSDGESVTSGASSSGSGDEEQGQETTVSDTGDKGSKGGTSSGGESVTSGASSSGSGDEGQVPEAIVSDTGDEGSKETSSGRESVTPGVSSSGSGDEEQVSGTTTPDHWIFSVLFQEIEKGKFTMGSPAGESERLGGPKQDDEKQVPVEITKSFEIMEKELTQKQWFLLKKENPSHFKAPGHCADHDTIEGVDMCPNHPVDSVSWDDVQGYIKELNASLGLTGCNGRPDDKSGCYRLPTEAEWEYAARGGTETAYFFGDDFDNWDYAWYSGNSEGRTHKVGTKDANLEGLYDIYGNVWEWVQDAYNKELPGGKDPLNDSGSGRVLRGGSVSRDWWELRSAYRFAYYPHTGYADTGFRLVRTL